MKQWLHLWSPCHHHSLSPPSIPSLSLTIPRSKHTLFSPIIKATLNPSPTTTSTDQQQLTGRERRQLRNQSRERKSGYNWREEVEERLIKKPKKKQSSWKEELNLDNLSDLGPQWWIIRVSRIRGHETAELVARLLARNYPEMEFKIYAPAVHVKRKLKNGTYSVKPKPIFPGCVFIRCVLNRELHDFIREIEGVGGFISSKVGNKIRQINKPKPVSEVDMEAIFRQAKEEQEKFDQAFEEAQRGEVNEAEKPVKVSKPKRESKRVNNKLVAAGRTVSIVSGTFAGFVGTLKKLSRKTGKATVELTLFGKETLVDLDIGEIAAETS